MIVINNSFDLLKFHDMEQLPTSVVLDVLKPLSTIIHLSPNDLTVTEKMSEFSPSALSSLPRLDFESLLGGHVYICESAEDLQSIQGCDFEWADSHGGVWPNVMDLGMAWDCCQYIEEPESSDPKWVVFQLCWNDSGGNLYYVPQSLWHLARVEEHMQITNQTWD